MPVSGRFDADFANFYDACQKAEVSLKGFESGSGRVESQLNRMVDSFTGRKVVAEAQLMAEAIERVGGPTKVAAADLEHASRTASEAADTFRRWGQEVPPNILRLAGATRDVNTSMTTAAKSIQGVDNVLDLFGVNLTGTRKALDDFGGASGKTIAQLGGIATGVLAASAAIGGWELGRKISELGNLDEIIGDTTAKLFGWGDVAGEKAAAAADSLARASKSAGFQVLSLSTAMAVNEAAAKAATEANQKYSDQLERMKAPLKAAEDLAKWNGEIAQIRKQGLLDALTADINTHAFSMQTLADRYRISTEALAIFARTAADVDRVTQSNAEKFAKLNLDYLEATVGSRTLAAKAADEARKKLFDEIDAAMQGAEAQKRLRDAAIDAQEATKKKTEEATAALRKEQEQADAVARALGNTIEYDLSTPEGLAQFKRLNPGASINAPEGYFQTHTLAEAVRAGLVNFYAGFTSGTHGETSGGGPLLPPLVTGGLGTAGATLVNPQLPINVNVTGVFDLSTAQKLADTVGGEVITRLKLNGYLPSRRG